MLFRYTILFSAFFIAACAAWFSVSGISQLFIGAQTAAMIMAISLESGKLAVVSFTYRYWEKINGLLKTYMTVGAVVLSVITSAGIFGYLHAAYASAAVGFSNRQAEVQVLTTRQASINTILESNNQRMRELQSYRTQQEERLNQLVGRQGFITQQRIVRTADDDIRSLQQQNTRLVGERDSLESVKSQMMTNALTENNKIGTFWYISQAIGIPLDKLVSWFIIAIVFVFDPLAVALILAYNFLIKNATPPKPYNFDSLEWIPPKSTKKPVVETSEPASKSKVEEKPITSSEVQPTQLEPIIENPKAAPPYLFNS